MSRHVVAGVVGVDKVGGWMVESQWPFVSRFFGEERGWTMGYE